MLQTLRTIQINGRDGSTGIELLSAMYKVVLFSWWFYGYGNTSSIVFRMLDSVQPGAWVLLVVGLVHCAAWTQPATREIRAIRKACSCFGLAIWSSFLYDLSGQSTGSAAYGLLILLMMVFMVVAVFRRVYPA